MPINILFYSLMSHVYDVYLHLVTCKINSLNSERAEAHQHSTHLLASCSLYGYLASKVLLVG